MSPRPKPADPEDVALEIAIAFGQSVVSEQCRIDKSAIPVFKQIFGATIGKALERKPDVWQDAGRAYVLKVVAKIARCACRMATAMNGGLIDGEILEQCALEKIAFEKTVCGYASTPKETWSLPWNKVDWGDFCPE